MWFIVKFTVSTWWCIGLSPLSAVARAGFRTTTGVHLHTGFKNVASLWPVCCPRPLETEAGEDAVPGKHSDSLRPPQTCAAILLCSWKKKSWSWRCGEISHLTQSVLWFQWFILHLWSSEDNICLCFAKSNFRSNTLGCRLVSQQRQCDPWKMRMYMRESVLWTILPVGLRQLTGRLFQPNPFLFTLWIIGQVGKAALVVPKPKKGNAGGCPACRAWKNPGTFLIPPKRIFFFFFSSIFSLLNQKPNQTVFECSGHLSERPLEGADTLKMRAAVRSGAEDTLLSRRMCVKSQGWC